MMSRESHYLCINTYLINKVIGLFFRGASGQGLITQNTTVNLHQGMQDYLTLYSGNCSIIVLVVKK